METLPTLNSKNFKRVICPTCETYPNRKANSTYTRPHINFTGIRWVVEKHILELQGFCVHCFKEHRVQIGGIDGSSLAMITLFNPKLSQDLGPVEEFLKRWG